MITDWEKGELHTEVSDRTGVSSHFTKAGKTSHKNKKTGDCSKRKLAIYPSPRTGWTAAGRGIFYNRLGRNSSVPLAIVV